MAHLGKIWERLFRRDLGYKPAPTVFQYLPKRYQWFLGSVAANPGLKFTTGLHISTPGDWDEASATLTYFFSDPGTFTPGINARFEYRLTFDAEFWEGKIVVAIGGTDKVYGVVPNYWPLRNISMSGQLIYVAPYTGPPTSWAPYLYPCTWANAPH